MKTYCFTVDDNIRFLMEIAERYPKSIFEHPYLSMYRRLHQEFGVRVQLNLFYRTGNFDLSLMPDTYYSEWEANADWLKLSFHADCEIVDPYASSDYEEVYADCKKVNDEILRFASPSALAKTTTVHWCQTTCDGVQALADHGVLGLLGLFGNRQNPKTSYALPEEYAKALRKGQTLEIGSMSFAAIAVILNNHSEETIIQKLDSLSDRDAIKIMIHEQYFYPDYEGYQPNFEEKLRAAFGFLRKKQYQSVFFEDLV